MPRTTSAEFKAAVEASGKLTKKPTDSELLQLYSLYKQATQSPPFESAPAPGPFDFKGKAKKAAWKKVVDNGTTPEEAEQEYVKLVDEFKVKYDYDADKKAEI